MKILSLFLIFFLFCNILLADELLIPYQCYPRLLVKKFAKHKMKLDLDPSKRNKKSWGYLKNEGAQYIIYTYRSVTQRDLTLILIIAREIEKERIKDVKKHRK